MTHKGVEVKKNSVGQDTRYLEEFSKRAQPSQKSQTMRRKIISKPIGQDEMMQTHKMMYTMGKGNPYGDTFKS